MLPLSSRGEFTSKTVGPPTEFTQFKEADLPGYNLVLQHCLTCHSQDYIEYQPRQTDRKGWEREVNKMKNAFKAPIPDSDILAIVDYLTKVYGAEKELYAQELKKESREPKIMQHITAKTHENLDPQSLLSSNGCLSCHSVNSKIVGPAFKEIAAKYGRSLNNQQLLMSNIKKGGAGQWGTIPMPPQEHLTESELMLIAQWILQQ